MKNEYGLQDSIRIQRPFLPEDAGPSWQSRFLVRLLRLLPARKMLASPARVQERVRKLALKPASYQPTGLGPNIDLQLRSVLGWPVYQTTPAGHPDVVNHVVFLHGGGYINEIVRAHWRFIGYMTREARVRCFVPIYPLAPGATAKNVVPLMGDLLAKILEETRGGTLTIVGNSAGAGLALAAAQWLRDCGYGQPGGLVLISPGINALINRPEQLLIAADDPVQAIAGIVETARLYAGDLDVAHPYVSPLNGDMHRLAPMTIFSGTFDLLYPDSVALAAKARAAGVPVTLHLRKGQPHNYPVFQTPEARQARSLILRAITRG